MAGLRLQPPSPWAWLSLLSPSGGSEPQGITPPPIHPFYLPVDSVQGDLENFQVLESLLKRGGLKVDTSK